VKLYLLSLCNMRSTHEVYSSSSSQTPQQVARWVLRSGKCSKSDQLPKLRFTFPGGFHVLLSRSVEKKHKYSHRVVALLDIMIYIMIILHIVWHWLYKQNSTSQDADESSEALQLPWWNLCEQQH
jgi:hypothetical protein